MNYNFSLSRILIILLICAAAGGCTSLYKQSVCMDAPQVCIDKAIKQARIYVDNHQWGQAVSVIENALEQFPDEPDLTELRKQYKDFQCRSVSENQYQILLKRSLYLLNVRTNKEKFFYAMSDRQASIHEHKKFQNEVAQVSAELFNKGQQFMAEGDFAEAEKVLSLSNQLVSSTAARQMIEEIHRVRHEKQSAAVRDKQITDHQKWCLLVSDFEKNLKASNLQKAKKILSEMESIKPDESTPMRSRLQELIDRKVEMMLEQGRYLYSRGDLSQAQDVWKQALGLKPDDPRLLEHIKRAGKFIENLDRWDK